MTLREMPSQLERPMAKCKIALKSDNFAHFRQFCRSLAACSSIAGCGCKSSEPGRDFNFWAIGSEVEKIGELFDEFQAAEPGHRRADAANSLVRGSREAAHGICRRRDARRVPVGQYMDSRICGRLAHLNRSTAYIERSKSIDPEDYFPGLWETNRTRSQVYGIPWYADTRLLFYRKDMLAKAGWSTPPRTWSEWLAAMRDVKHKVNPNGYAILMPTNEWEHLTILGLQTGSQMLRDDGQYGNFDSPEFRRAFEFYAQVFDEGLAPAVTKTQISNYWEEFAAVILQCT